MDSPRLFASLWGLWLFRWGRGDGPGARDLAPTLRGHATRSLDSGHVLRASHASWATSFSLGHLDEAVRHATEGCALYSIEPHAALASAYGDHDAGVCAMNFRARALVLLGAVDEAVSVSEAAVALARELEHPFTLAQTLFFASTVHHARRDPAASEFTGGKFSSLDLATFIFHVPTCGSTNCPTRLDEDNVATT